jgi:hypothetical protein
LGFSWTQTDACIQLALACLHEILDGAKIAQESHGIGFIDRFYAGEGVDAILVAVSFWPLLNPLSRGVLKHFVGLYNFPRLFVRPSEHKREIGQEAYTCEVFEGVLGVFYIDVHKQYSQLIVLSQLLQTFVDVIWLQVVILDRQEQNTRLNKTTISAQ